MSEEKNVYKELFVEYCRDHLIDDKTVHYMDDIYEIDSPLLFTTKIGGEECEVVESNVDDDVLYWVDKNGNGVSTHMTDFATELSKLEFDNITHYCFENVLRHWDELYMDESINNFNEWFIENDIKNIREYKEMIADNPYVEMTDEEFEEYDRNMDEEYRRMNDEAEYDFTKSMDDNQFSPKQKETNEYFVFSSNLDKNKLLALLYNKYQYFDEINCFVRLKKAIDNLDMPYVEEGQEGLLVVSDKESKIGDMMMSYRSDFGLHAYNVADIVGRTLSHESKVKAYHEMFEDESLPSIDKIDHYDDNAMMFDSEKPKVETKNKPKEVKEIVKSKNRKLPSVEGDDIEKGYSID